MSLLTYWFSQNSDAQCFHFKRTQCTCKKSILTGWINVKLTAQDMTFCYNLFRWMEEKKVERSNHFAIPWSFSVQSTLYIVRPRHILWNGRLKTSKIWSRHMEPARLLNPTLTTSPTTSLTLSSYAPYKRTRMNTSKLPSHFSCYSNLTGDKAYTRTSLKEISF